MNKSLLREFFVPKSKKDVLTIFCILLAFGGFIVYEGFAFYTIAQNPHGFDEWYTTATISTNWIQDVDTSLLFTNSAELNSDEIFVIELNFLEGFNITIEFDAIHCIISRIVFMRGALTYRSPGYTFIFEEDTSLNITEPVTLNLREMSYPDDYDVLFIRAKPMGTTGVKLMHKITLS